VLRVGHAADRFVTIVVCAVRILTCELVDEADVRLGDLLCGIRHGPVVPPADLLLLPEVYGAYRAILPDQKVLSLKGNRPGIEAASGMPPE